MTYHCDLCEDLAWMLDNGESLERAAARLGRAPSTLEHHMRRWRDYGKAEAAESAAVGGDA